MDDVLCTGRETHLQNCTHSQDASEDYHSEDASVRCFQPGECVTGELRLAGGNGVSSGRVEVCVGGVWGTVADDLEMLGCIADASQHSLWATGLSAVNRVTILCYTLV